MTTGEHDFITERETKHGSATNVYIHKQTHTRFLFFKLLSDLKEEKQANITTTDTGSTAPERKTSIDRLKNHAASDQRVTH